LESTIESNEQKFTPAELWVLLAAILASSMSFIDSSALNVALPSIQSSLGASATQLLWVINANTLMLASLILVGGSLGDKLGRKRVFMTGISISILASLACSLAPTIQWLIVARIFQGIGGALLVPGSLSIIAAMVAPERMGKAIGTWSAITTLILIVGPIMGGIFADLGFWRGVFIINIPLGIFALVSLIAKVGESRNTTSSSKIDVPGAILITISLAGLAYGFTSAPDFGFANPRVFLPLAVGALALPVFLWVESRTENAMMPLHLFKSRTFSGTNLLTFFLYSSLSVFSFFLTLNLIQVQGYTTTQAGLAIMPFVIFLTLLSRWAGGLVDKVGPRLPLIIGPALTGFGFLWISFSGVTRGPIDYWTAYLPGVILFGIGMGLTVAPLSTSVMGSVGKSFSGVASGINNAISRVGSVLAIAILGTFAIVIFTNALADNTNALNLPSPLQASLMQEASKLAGAEVPIAATNVESQGIQAAIHQSYASTFRVIMLICASLAWLSALISSLMIESRLFRQETG
jgi:EmrB/QacA subfamily drug resistance transporter